jgi:hypothetical protein
MRTYCLRFGEIPTTWIFQCIKNNMYQNFVITSYDVLRFLIKMWNEDEEIVEHALKSTKQKDCPYIISQALLSGQAIPLMKPMHLL